MKESGIKIDGKNVTFNNTLNVYMMKKISESIDEIKLRQDGDDKIEVCLKFSELQLIRRMLIEEEIRNRLMYHNVVENFEYIKSKDKTYWQVEHIIVYY